MPIRVKENLLGARVFLIGIILAILFGAFFGGKINPIILGVISLLGIIVGYTVSEENAQAFLIASVSLVLVSYAGMSGLVLDAAIRGIAIGRIMSSILGTLLVLFVPATITVAIKTVFSLSRMKKY